MNTAIELPTGAQMRLTGPAAQVAVVCINGGQRRPVEGTWSATIEWLVRHLAPRLPDVGFAEVRYRIKSWTRFDWCEQDARAAVRAVGAPRTLFVGFSMGGAVAVHSADEPTVEGILGLAPWLPEKLELGRLRGKRLDVLHGLLDRWLPGIPGVSPSSSRAGFERAKTLGVDGSYQVISGAVHGLALRSPLGLVPLPRAGRWVELAAERIGAWAAAGAAVGKAA